MLLPPNATKQEKALIDAIDYKVDPSCVKGFKFSLGEKILPWLVEEYGLGEILRWVKDKRKAIKEGIKFQRLRGTPASLKIALKWANIEDITIIEEPPGEHFFELQIGIKDVPKDFFVDAVVELAKLSLPARSRLMRIFNDYYNAQRFILDESLFGDLLSDYSGVKIEKDGPVLSFGRKNTFELKILNPTFKFGTFRIHYEQALSNDLYRLDVAILGETEPHTKNYNGIYERSHQWNNLKTLYPLPQSLLPEIKFAKVQIVLSDQSPKTITLEEVNYSRKIMKSQNSYSGINPIVVKYVKYYAKCLKRLKCFADESIEDIEQELFLLVWPTIIQYDESKSCFVAFVKQLVKCRAINLVYRQSCEKRGGKQGILYIDHTILDNIADERCRFEDEIADRSDLDYIVSTLPQEWQVLCRQLEIFSVPEVAEIRGIARTTVYDILRRIRRHTKKVF